jgi:integrase
MSHLGDDGNDAEKALSALDSACSHCGKAIRGSFRYCDANCKKLAKKQRRQAKRDFITQIPDSMSQVEEVHLSTKRIRHAEQQYDEEQNAQKANNPAFEENIKENLMDCMDLDEGSVDFALSDPEKADLDQTPALPSSANLLARIKPTPLPAPTGSGHQAGNVSRRRFSFSSLGEVKALQESAKDQSHYITESMGKHMTTSRNSFLEFCKAAYPELTVEALKTKSEEDVAQLVLEYCVAALQDCSQVEGDRPMLGMESFRDTYIPNLLRWFDMEKIHYALDLRQRVREKIKKMVKRKELTKAQLPDQKGANPLTTTDLNYIVRTTPCGIDSYLEIMTWLVLAVHSGMRGISIVNLKWKHIQAYPGEIKITWECEKGNHSWNHTQMMSGSFTSPVGNSPLFWLTQLWRQHQQDLNSLLPRMSSLDKFVFQGCGGMHATFRSSSHAEYYRRHLQRITTLCGYPPKFFANHSMRSGCQISLYIKQSLQEDGRTKEAIWDNIALYIGYTPQSKNQIAYFKNNFRDVLTVNNVLLEGNEFPTAAISKTRFESIELFHNLPKLTPLWTEEDRTFLIRKTVLACAKRAAAENAPRAQIQSMASKFYQEAASFELYSDRVQELTGIGESPSKGVVKYFLELVETQWQSRQIPLWFVIGEIMDQPWIQECFREAALAFKPIGPMSKPRKPRKLKKSKRMSFRKLAAAARVQQKEEQAELRQKELKYLQEAAQQQEEQAAKPKQKRRKWNDVETRILCEMVVGNQSGSAIWREISNEISQRLQFERGNVHCKDRMRTLCEQLGENDNQKAAQKWLDLHADGAAAEAQDDVGADQEEDVQDEAGQDEEAVDSEEKRDKESKKRARK